MHYIHKYILDRIIHAKQLRNRDLRPPRVESNLFQYHLKQLIKDGFIQKTPQGLYELAKGGVFWSDRFSGELQEMRPQSKVITLLCIRDSLGKFLLLEKLRQPFIETFHFPAGKIHLGESWDDAAKREYREKISVYIPSLDLHSTVHVTISSDTLLLQDYIAVIYLAELADTAAHIPCKWVDKNEFQNANLMPGVPELIEHVTNSTHTTAEIRVTVP